MFYEDRGSGIPIIFIHPPGMGRKVFFYQLLLEEHFRIILPDLSGHGDTKGSQETVTINGFVEEIKMLMDKLQIDRAVICGYSSGGIVAQEFCLQFPERVIGIVLSGGFAEVQSLIFKYEHIIGMYMVKHYPAILAKMIAGSHTNFDPLRKLLFRHMLKADRRIWFEFYKQSLFYTCLDRLTNWSRPLLLIYGSKDFTNQHARAYQKTTDIQSIFIRSASHQIPVQNWKIFNQMISGFALTYTK